MKDIYEIFANIYRQECAIRGYVDSGIILFREEIMRSEPFYSTVRIIYDGTKDDFEFENDFYEGQECVYVRSMTDTEIRKMMEGILT